VKLLTTTMPLGMPYYTDTTTNGTGKVPRHVLYIEDVGEVVLGVVPKAVEVTRGGRHLHRPLPDEHLDRTFAYIERQMG